jgi:crossover junction endodeoxyribonuclease RuvC
MIILGIDPGLRTTGFGVIEKHGSTGCAISRPAPSRPVRRAPCRRLKIILSGISEVVATYKPACAAIEKVFVNVNPQSTLLLGAGARRRHHGLVGADLEVAEYTPARSSRPWSVRQGRQGAGAGHGGAPAQACPACPAPTPPTRSASPSATRNTAWMRWR